VICGHVVDWQWHDVEICPWPAVVLLHIICHCTKPLSSAAVSPAGVQFALFVANAP